MALSCLRGAHAGNSPFVTVTRRLLREGQPVADRLNALTGGLAVVYWAMQTQELLDRYEYTTKLQRTEIARLRAVVERQEEELTQLLAWINGDSDSLTILQRIAQDPRTLTSDRIKACAAAVAYERHKLTVQLRVGPSVLSERLAHARAIKTAEPKVIEHSPLDAA